MSLLDLVLQVHDALDAADLAHGFGGALALAYIAQPRGTVDVDVNVFSPTSTIDDILGAFAEIGLNPERNRAEWLPSAGIRLRRASEPFPVDVFPSLDDHIYAEIERRCVRRPFGPSQQPLPFLSAEDLAVFKLSFGRDKDWVDLRAIVAATPGLDVGYIEQHLVALRGPHMHPRLARLRRLVRSS